jgi:hypothetical protein
MYWFWLVLVHFLTLGTQATFNKGVGYFREKDNKLISFERK